MYYIAISGDCILYNIKCQVPMTLYLFEVRLCIHILCIKLSDVFEGLTFQKLVLKIR